MLAPVGAVGGRLAEQVVNAGVRDEGLEAVRVALDPVHEEAAVGAARGGHPVFVHVALRDQEVGRLHDVGEGLVRMRAEDGLDPGVAEARESRGSSPSRRCSRGGEGVGFQR
jgi:hypothetical protein